MTIFRFRVEEPEVEPDAIISRRAAPRLPTAAPHFSSSPPYAPPPVPVVREESSSGRQKMRRVVNAGPSAYPVVGWEDGVGSSLRREGSSESEMEPEESLSEGEEEEEEEELEEIFDDEEEEEEEAAAVEESEDDAEPAPVSGSDGSEKESVDPASEKSITFTMSDPDIFDCGICFEALRSPIYQCKNGHIVCSSCCSKLASKCPQCAMPIGDIRCRALEKVIESMRVTCKYSRYGCRETISYHERQEHDKSCFFVPCQCPLTCSFIGSLEDLCDHFSYEHSGSGTSFNFNISKSICLRFGTRFHVLQEQTAKELFLLTNEETPLGNTITISCIGPPSGGDHIYELTARSGQTLLQLQTFTKCTQGPYNAPQTSPYLMVPVGFFGASAVTMTLEFTIRHYHTRFV